MSELFTEMKRGRGRPKKDPFEDIEEEFKAKANSATKEEIDRMFAEVAKQTAELVAAQKEDQDLADKRAAAKFANSVYAEGLKVNKKKAEYLRRTLNSQGS